jgi:tetratricopeptide (TPR) repeat protein
MPEISGVYKRAIAIFEEEGSLLKLADCSRLQAKAYLGAGDLTRCEEALERSEACLEFLSCEETTGKLNFSRARLLAAKGQHVQAIAAYQRLFEPAKELGKVEFTTKIAFERAKSELAIGEYDNAAKTFRKLALALQGTSSPITKLDCLRQLTKTYELAGKPLDEEATLREILALPELEALPDEINLLKLQLGLTLSHRIDNARGLKELEALPREVFAVGSESWMEHGMGLMKSYEKAGRFSDCVFLANEMLATDALQSFDGGVEFVARVKENVVANLNPTQT